MSLGKARLYMVCYDIANPRRLLKVHRYLKSVAIPLQYSVFLTRCTPRVLDGYFRELSRIIKWSEDDVRAYPLPGDTRMICLGRQVFSGGLTLHDAAGQLDSVLQPSGCEDDTGSPVPVSRSVEPRKRETV